MLIMLAYPFVAHESNGGDLVPVVKDCRVVLLWVGEDLAAREVVALAELAVKKEEKLE